MEENETVEIGGVKVPKQFADRWNELIANNRKMKADLLEANAKVTAAEQEVSTAGAKALEKANARISELEGQIAESAWSLALAEDGIGEDADTVDYLKYQYGKVTPEEGKEKPAVKDWYSTIRETNPVVKAAKSAKATDAAAAKKAAAGTNVTAGAGAAAGTGTAAAPKKITASTAAPPRQIAATEGAVTAESLTKMDVSTFAANKEQLRKQLFGS